MRDKRKCPSCRIGFQSCFDKNLHLTVFVIVAHDFSLNRDRLVLEVDRIPPQTKYLTSSQTIIRCDVHHKLQFIIFEYLKQLIITPATKYR